MFQRILKITLLVIGLIFVWGYSGVSGWGFDPGWHVHNGLWMLQHHAILHRDNFTWKSPQTPWANIEWGFDLLVGWVYSFSGWVGTRWLVVLVYAGIFGLILRQSQLKSFRCIWVYLTAFLLVATSATVRPQIFSYLFFAIALIGVLRGKNLSLLSLLVIPWNNFHASAILWLGLLAIETLLSKDKKSLWKAWVISLLGFCVSPNSIGSLISFTRMQGNKLSLLISEYQSPSFHNLYPWIIIGLLLMTGYQAIKKSDLRSQLWVLAGLGAYLFSQRFGTYSVIITILLIDVSTHDDRKTYFGISLITTVISLALCVSFIQQPFSQPVEYQAVKYLASIHATHILNQYEYGSTLEMGGLTPICDGRDIWLGQKWYDRYFETLVGQYSLKQLIQKYIPNAKYAIFPLKGLMAYQIENLPDWKVVYKENDVGVWCITKTTFK